MLDSESDPLLSGSTMIAYSGAGKKILVFIAVAIVLSVIASICLSSVAIVRNTQEQSCNAKDYPIKYQSFLATQNKATNRFSVPPGNALIQNVTIWTVNSNDEVLQNYDILIIEGSISQIAQNIQTPPNFNGTVYNGAGRYATPGLVDMHSHAGVYAAPGDAFGTNDGNEATNPTLPAMRAIDALNPNDPEFADVVSGGTTTAMVLPGSANVMGGEAAMIKIRGHRVGDMLIPGAPRAIKMACGENPKGVYGSRGETPSTRMGVGWEFRRKFFEAATLLAQQNRWNAQSGDGYTCPADVYPATVELDGLIGALNGEVLLMIHCYMVEDLEMIFRTSDEFGFTVAAFHHALEAWKIPDLIKDRNISIATFAAEWGFKMEGYDGSVHAIKTLMDAGVNTALKTDHPVINAKYFVHEAAKATHYGITWQQAIRSITINPAKALRLDARVGSIEVGKDGDIAVWDRKPTDLGARPNRVLIEGNVIFSNDSPSHPDAPASTAVLVANPTTACQSPSFPYAVVGATVYTMDDSDTVINNAVLLVNSNGTIECLQAAPGCTIPQGTPVFTVTGGSIVPGLVHGGSTIGLSDVTQEPNSQDGQTEDVDGSLIKAVDGVRLNNWENRKVIAARNGGVTTVVTSPMGSSLVVGQSVAFHTLNGSLIDDALISDSATLDVYIGNKAKRSVSSISGQIGKLRALFQAAVDGNGTTTPYHAAIAGTLPVVAYVNQVDEINSMVRLKKEFGFPLVIKGGAEAHMMKEVLAEQGVSVMLWPARPMPREFETWNLDFDSAITLHDAGVNVGLTAWEDNHVRELLFEAGYFQARGLNTTAALAMVTRNVARAHNIQNQVGSLQVGRKADFVALNGEPLSLNSQILLVGIGNQFLQCNPQQY